jgi:hypothetical protein
MLVGGCMLGKACSLLLPNRGRLMPEAQRLVGLVKVRDRAGSTAVTRADEVTSGGAVEPRVLWQLLGNDYSKKVDIEVDERAPREKLLDTLGLDVRPMTASEYFVGFHSAYLYEAESIIADGINTNIHVALKPSLAANYKGCGSVTLELCSKAPVALITDSVWKSLMIPFNVDLFTGIRVCGIKNSSEILEAEKESYRLSVEMAMLALSRIYTTSNFFSLQVMALMSL